jgi:hypothetical protein
MNSVRLGRRCREGESMLNRRVDAVYFVILVAALAIGYYASNRSVDEGSIPDLPDFDPPQLTLEVPFDFPYSIPSFKTRVVPALRISDNVESVLVEVRSSLLASSTPVEARATENLAAVLE